jgi:hypothetical protein
MRPATAILILLALLLTLLAGCVRRTLTVRSDPPGALVYLNGQEFGRTPVTSDITWYGTYDVQLRKDGYETLKTRGKVIAPWWQWVPIDLAAELLPLTDRQHLSYRLRPTTQSAATTNPDAVLARAARMRGELRSGKYTRTPSTVPTAPRAADAGAGPTTQPMP